MSLARLVVLALAAVPAAVHAGPMGAGGPLLPRPAFLEQLFPPHVVMRHQQEIGLTEAQRKAITGAITETQQKLVDQQWTLENDSEALRKLLDRDPVDEAAAMAQSDKVLAAEQRIKREHLRLLIRVKNELTPEQEAKLRELEPNRMRGRRQGRRPNAE